MSAAGGPRLDRASNSSTVRAASSAIVCSCGSFTVEIAFGDATSFLERMPWNCRPFGLLEDTSYVYIWSAKLRAWTLPCGSAVTHLKSCSASREGRRLSRMLTSCAMLRGMRRDLVMP